MKNSILTSIALAAFGQAFATNNQPNVVVILTDDLGYSDLGCYGGEVKTPNIDGLAFQGTRFTQFKNTGRSCPTRAALVTGHYQHAVGMGWMTAVDEHRDGYRGQIVEDIPTIAEVFNANGYKTYMSGKWHLTADGAVLEPNGSVPTKRGFDKYYGALVGGGGYYKPRALYDQDQLIETFADDYYYTHAITDSIVSFINNHPQDEPMFMYAAHYAPHLPLEAPKDRVEKCKDRYRVGFDVLRQQRFDRMKELGIVDESMDLPMFQAEFNGKRPTWESLTDKQQEIWINDMATYAAMIEIMDDGVGALINALKEKGMYENTIFMFLSDNGSTAESGYIKQIMADLSNTPYRSYKKWVFQGGTSTPFILTYGDKAKNNPGAISTEVAHVIDILPTCVELASLDYPTEFKGRKTGMNGISIVPALENKELAKRNIYFEHETSCAIISDNWKLVRLNGNQPWELINLITDPFEQNDLSAQYPEKVKELEAEWTTWANGQPVFPFEYRGWGERIKHYKSLNPAQKGDY